jgi:hypothetical protein
VTVYVFIPLLFIVTVRGAGSGDTNYRRTYFVENDVLVIGVLFVVHVCSADVDENDSTDETDDGDYAPELRAVELYPFVDHVFR